jgi:acetyl-CoA synthetase/4-hydroxybutyrate---CoA ligase (AMP-forming)
VPKTISGKIRRIDLRDTETERQESEKDEDLPVNEYFYWDFPELSSKKK